MRIDNGLSDLKTENARLGRDWRKGLRQMKREMEWKEFYGVMQEEKEAEATQTSKTSSAAKAEAHEKHMTEIDRRSNG